MEVGKVVTIGVAFAIALIVGLIIGFTIITNLVTVESDLATRTATINVVNESGFQLNGTDLHLIPEIQTANAPNVVGYDEDTCALLSVTNGSSGLGIVNANITFSTACVANNATEEVWLNASITYSYGLKETEASVETIRNNFTAGVSEVSNKLPTIFLIAAIVIVLGILMILWAYYKRMGVGESRGGL